MQLSDITSLWGTLCFDIQCVRLYDRFSRSGGRFVTNIDQEIGTHRSGNPWNLQCERDFILATVREKALDSVVSGDTFGVYFGPLLGHSGHFRHRDDSFAHNPRDARGAKDWVDLGCVCYAELDIDCFPCEDTAIGDTESDADVAGFTLYEFEAGGWLGDGQWRACWLG